jgi:hypothetical protein
MRTLVALAIQKFDAVATQLYYFFLLQGSQEAANGFAVGM